MKLKSEPQTEVFINEDETITIIQPNECMHCGRAEPDCVTLSAQRARLVSAELLRLADEIESK